MYKKKNTFHSCHTKNQYLYIRLYINLKLNRKIKFLRVRRTNPDEFEKSTLFILLGLSSTLKRINPKQIYANSIV